MHCHPRKQAKWWRGHWRTETTVSAYTTMYNLAGRQVTLIKSGVTTTYAYDSEGRRIRKFISAGTGAGAASTVVFAYDQDDQLLGEYDASGNAIREYVWLGRLAQRRLFGHQPAGGEAPWLRAMCTWCSVILRTSPWLLPMWARSSMQAWSARFERMACRIWACSS